LNFAIVVAVFPIIFLGELPDKTMFASLVMATRGRPLFVWFGAAGAFVVHVVIATTIGVALFRPAAAPGTRGRRGSHVPGRCRIGHP